MGATAAAALASLLVGCSSSEEPEETVITLLVADREGARGEAVAETFETTVATDCPDCRIEILDAAGDSDEQSAQLSDALSEADAVVVEPLDVDALAGEVADAEVPVVSMDRAIPGARAHVGLDRGTTADVIADAALQLTGKKPTVVVAAGVPGSAAATLTEQVVEALGERARVADTLDEPVAAAQAARRAGADLVVTGDDRDAAQAARELKGEIAVTGFGGDLPAVRRVAAGTQALTVLSPWGEEGVFAANEALKLADVDVPPPSASAPEPREVDGVPTTLLEPTVVTLDTLTNTVVRHNVFTIDEICAGKLSRRCTALGFR